MNFPGNFQKLGAIDISALRRKITDVQETDWDTNTMRQNAFLAHRDTQTLYLLFDDDFRHVGPPTKHAHYEVFREEVESIFETIGTNYDSCHAVRAMLTRLKPGGCIPAHIDHGFSLTRSHRVHVPVLSSGRVSFTVGDESICMNEGEVWEINNTRPHSVTNLGSTPRVHLIVDWAPQLSAAEEAEYQIDRQERQRRLQQGRYERRER